MPYNSLPGFTSGTAVKRYSSMDERVIGKLTDQNHIQALQRFREPAKYDKDIVTIFTQTSQQGNDFHQMLMNSKPFELPYGSPDTFQWKVGTTLQLPKIVAIPDTTRTQTNIGLDGDEFEIVFDKEWFSKGQIITADKIYGQQFMLMSDGEPYSSNAYKYTAVLFGNNASQTTSVDKRWLAEGREYEALSAAAAGEFSQEGSGLGPMGDTITLAESLGAGWRVEHTVTGWASDMGIDPKQDLIVYQNWQRNEVGEVKKGPIMWEPYVEKMLRDQLITKATERAIWAQGGTVSNPTGPRQEKLYVGTGLYPRMRSNGNYFSYNRGEFSINMLRMIFRDLYYRRVAMGDRRVKIYSNEAGMNAFEQAIKKDVFMSGISLMDGGTGNGFIQGSGMNRRMVYGFDSFVSRETGVVEIIHLKELDLPNVNTEFGQNYYSTPRFIVFDVTPGSEGMPQDNIRIVRRERTPNIKWAYVDGLTSHLGPMASQGHSAASGFNGYTIHMENRWDVFIEDASRCVLIEEIPQF